MNNMSLKDKIKNIANKKNVNFNSVLRMYMYDRFIERLAISKYKDNFILKGGFYLSTLFGIENRSTRDIDTAIKDIDFTKENITKIIFEIINIDICDDCTIEIIDVDDIRQEDEYGGYRFTLLVKLETILNSAETSSRTRDYCDVYLIYKMYSNSINKGNFRSAVKNTFNKREYSGDILRTFEIIKNSDILRTRWMSYSRNNKYAENITYEDIINCLEELIEILEPIAV